MTEPTLKTDIVVVGAGMVGATAALGFAQQGFQVSLIEPRSVKTEFDPELVDNRVSALTRASENLLTKLGVWNAMRAMRIEAYSDMHVWDAGGEGVIHFDAADFGEPSLGHIVENQVTQLALWQAMLADKNITIHCPDSVVDVSRDSQSSFVHLKSGMMIEAKLVVAADGKNSAIRGMLGIETQGWLYDQHAVVATVTTSLGHQHTAWQRFMPDGPLALLPLGHQADKACSIVWSTTPENAEQLKELDEATFCQSLTEVSEGVLGDIVSVESRAAFPLELKHAKTYIKEGFVLIGDAAHAVHPLAGQGVNLGFLDVEALINLVGDAKNQKRDIGGLKVLRKYERERKGSNLTMLAVMDAFKRIFSNNNVPITVTRNAALSLVNNMGPIKNFFVRYAMGLH